MDEFVELRHAGDRFGLGDESAAEDTDRVAGLRDLNGVIDVYLTGLVNMASKTGDVASTKAKHKRMHDEIT